MRWNLAGWNMLALAVLPLTASMGCLSPDREECFQDNHCPQGQHCLSGRCLPVTSCQTDADCKEPVPVCDTNTGECTACTPDCTGKCCGDDGCGGSCEDLCASTGQTCNQVTCLCQGTCEPNCLGRQCGPSGCPGDECPPGCGPAERCDLGHCEPSGCTQDADCSLPTPRCDLATGQCVQCLAPSDCGAERVCSDGVCIDQPICASDEQCEMGQICVNGACEVGCNSDRDCPALPRPEHCIPSLGPHGTCVECEQPPECGPGQTCENYHCVPYCTEDAHCSPSYCEPTTHRCVDCLQDAHCDVNGGLICLNRQCLKGCRADADCQGGYCDTNTYQCFECLANSDCALGNICIERMCVVGCTSSRDCPGLYCDTNQGAHGACVECLTDEHCVLAGYVGYLCQNGLCVFRCSSDADCIDPEPACDTQSGTCVICTGNQHCSKGTICESLACVPGCQIDSDCPSGMVCDPSLGSHGGCVNCLVDLDCPTGYSCQYHRCVLEGSEMIRVPGGSFIMGSDPGEGEADEEPEWEVTLPTFYIDRTEVTNTQYRACVQASSCSDPQDTSAYNHPGKGDHPVVWITRSQAVDYCSWMDKDLPTEARWERAARGPGALELTYPWGNIPPDCSLANYSGCVGDTAAVGSYYLKGASVEGVLDLAGNVYEWIYDRYDSGYYGTLDNHDPWGPLEGDYWVIRGGAFDSLAEHIRCANRASRLPDDAGPNLGFRCAVVGAPTASFTVDPAAGPFDTTTFKADASGSTDPNHSPDTLEVRWDWESDDTYDIAWTTAKTATRRYAYCGIFRITLEVRDPDGNTDTSSTEVVAEGANGWDGALCQSNQECAHGFVCVFSLDTFPFTSVCREDCMVLLDPECHIAGRRCQLGFDPNIPGVVSACYPG